MKTILITLLQLATTVLAAEFVAGFVHWPHCALTMTLINQKETR